MIAPLGLAFAVLEHPDGTVTPAAGRLLAEVDEPVLVRLRSARAAARERAWMQAADHGTAPLLPWPTDARYPAWSWTSTPRRPARAASLVGNWGPVLKRSVVRRGPIGPAQTSV
ncbi:hypothetical protein ACFCZT_35605 [Streptomyces sp. NPDC056230]|uniref:hypothetical protein n=1 Tax=Streptomyces sp. NPDC056230 TaxID=3345754 RepID=UPI0035D928FE